MTLTRSELITIVSDNLSEDQLPPNLLNMRRKKLEQLVKDIYSQKPVDDAPPVSKREQNGNIEDIEIPSDSDSESESDSDSEEEGESDGDGDGDEEDSVEQKIIEDDDPASASETEDEDELNPEIFLKEMEQRVNHAVEDPKPKKKKSKTVKKKVKAIKEPVAKKEKKVRDTSPKERLAQRVYEKKCKTILENFKNSVSKLIAPYKSIINKYGSLTQAEDSEVTQDYNNLREELEDDVELLFSRGVEPSPAFYTYMNRLVERQMNRVQRLL
jgi:hypothetical protein